MKRFTAVLAATLISLSGFPQASLDYYLGEGDFLPGIPTPESIIGYQVGEWHLSHDKLSHYLGELAAASDRIVYQEYARSYENRPLFHLIITSPENHQRLEEIRTDHLKLSDPDRSPSLNIENMPVIVRLGYNIHGNESSASNASVLVAYHLAASRSVEVKKYLQNMVILIDPCLNPDGLNRHASWVNMHKSTVPMNDDNSRGFREAWPGGRTNHYWFDLNRDWILLQHPETRGRVEVYHDWKPNVQTDHHEMASSSTFFFQPGVPSRTNPFTPREVTDLTRRIGQYHADALDGIGSLFFTEERFDDFYYGKGSSYPDVNGGIGILFEQAGTRGFERTTPQGELSFPYAIRNQVKVSFSSLKASGEMRMELLEHQRSFYLDSKRLYERSPEKSYVFGENGDPSTLSNLLDVLLRHRIEVYRLKTSLSAGGTTYTPEASYMLPLDQPQYRLIQSLFMPATTFTDSLFYDVSTWTFPYAFNIPYASVKDAKTASSLRGDRVTAVPEKKGGIAGEDIPKGDQSIGYIFPWNDYYAPRVLYRLLEAGLIVRVATEPLGFKDQIVDRSFSYGSIFVPVQRQDPDPGALRRMISMIAEETGISVYPVSTSYTVKGMDMGSGKFVRLKKPGILLLTGNGISSGEAGEIWHLLDIRMEMPIVLVSIDQLNSMDLTDYTHLVLPSGSYNAITQKGITEIERWLARGGTIIALNTANRWLAENKLADVQFKRSGNDSTGYKNYSVLNPESGARKITGAIFNARLDISHPIGYGLNRKTIPVFRNSTLIAETIDRPYAVPLSYTQDPLLSGYVPREKYEDLRGTAGVVISSLGSGKIISFIDNPNFRGFWYGTNRLFMNAIFFGPVISSASAR